MRGIVITGATGGIGRELSKICTEGSEFDRCVLYCRDRAILQKHIDLTNENVCVAEYDMEKECDRQGLVPEKTLEGVSDITIVLLAFSIEPIALIGSIAPEERIKNIKINIMSQLNFLEQYVKYAKTHNLELKVVFLDSGAAYKPLNGWSLYCCSKAYMDMYIRCLARERQCRVVLYDPGVVDTDMQRIIRDSSPEVFDRVEEFRGYKEDDRLNPPDRVAEDIYVRYLKEWNARELCERYHA